MNYSLHSSLNTIMAKVVRARRAVSCATVYLHKTQMARMKNIISVSLLNLTGNYI